MKIFFDNVNFESSSGPNSFASKLASTLVAAGHEITDSTPDAQISFIQRNADLGPCLLRLDGIYFNSGQDWNTMNEPIKNSYDSADSVIVQSIFNKKLIFKYFGKRENVTVIRNGTLLDTISQIPKAAIGDLGRDKVWLCASSWRPHKRLDENIRYFQDHAGDDSVLLVAGEHANTSISDDRINFLGNLNWYQLISAMKASSMFLHLAWLDHCPNVVVDARAAGCHIVCSSSGGTEEIAGTNSTVIEEDIWDFSPIELYSPPPLDFSRSRDALNYDSNVDIKLVADQYLSVIKEMIEL